MAPHQGQLSTRIHTTNWILAIVCCINSVSRIHGSIQTSPQNQIVTVGANVTFFCSSDTTNKTITWIYKPPYKLMSASTFPLTISNGTERRPPFLDKVEVGTNTDSSGTIPVVFYNLTVKNVQFGDAGLYTCQDNNGYGQPVRGALLAVVDKPACNLDPNVTTSSDNVTVNCTVSYCGNFTFISDWTDITSSKSPFTMSSQQPKYQSNPPSSSSVSSRTETIVNGFKTTIYTQTSSATVTNSSQNYSFYFKVTPDKPQILSDTIDSSVPSTPFSYYVPVIISLSVSETGCSFQTSGNTPLNDGSTIFVNSPVWLITSNYPPPSYEWVVCYNASNCTTSTNEEILFGWPGIISSLNCTVTNRIEDRSYTCYNTLKNINVQSSNDTKADVHVEPSQADRQTGSAPLTPILVPIFVILVIIIIGVIVFFSRKKLSALFSNKGGTCFNRQSSDLSSQPESGQTKLANNCPQQNGKDIVTNDSASKVAYTNRAYINKGFTKDQIIIIGNICHQPNGNDIGGNGYGSKVTDNNGVDNTVFSSTDTSTPTRTS